MLISEAEESQKLKYLSNHRDSDFFGLPNPALFCSIP